MVYFPYVMVSPLINVERRRVDRPKYRQTYVLTSNNNLFTVEVVLFTRNL